GGQAVSGTLPRSARAQPEFQQLDDRPSASLVSGRLAGSRSFGRFDVLLALVVDRTRLPFVALAPLGAETRAFGSADLADWRPRASRRASRGAARSAAPSRSERAITSTRRWSPTPRS